MVLKKILKGDFHFVRVAPSPPIVNAVTAIDATSVRVEWSVPSKINGILSTYSITYTNEDGITVTETVPFNGQPVSDML